MLKWTERTYCITAALTYQQHTHTFGSIWNGTKFQYNVSWLKSHLKKLSKQSSHVLSHTPQHCPDPHHYWRQRNMIYRWTTLTTLNYTFCFDLWKSLCLIFSVRSVECRGCEPELQSWVSNRTWWSAFHHCEQTWSCCEAAVTIHCLVSSDFS